MSASELAPLGTHYAMLANAAFQADQKTYNGDP